MTRCIAFGRFMPSGGLGEAIPAMGASYRPGRYAGKYPPGRDRIRSLSLRQIRELSPQYLFIYLADHAVCVVFDSGGILGDPN